MIQHDDTSEGSGTSSEPFSADDSNFNIEEMRLKIEFNMSERDWTLSEPSDVDGECAPGL